MKCMKCGSENIDVTVVNEQKLKRKHNWLYWAFIGWWLNPIMWVLFFLPMLIIRIFKPKKHKLTNKQKTVCLCQSCGHRWDIKG